MTLSERHLAELRDESGIPLDAIDAEGIRSVTMRTEVASLGYTEHWQQLVPAIVYPVHPPDGSNSLYVIKPDHPRPRKDKPHKFIKYEWPAGHPHRLDVVGDLADLSDPTVDLYLVEGKKKALALLAEMRRRGRRCVIIVIWGTYAWVLAKSGCQLLPDFDLISLDGRRVFIVFDSDREDKADVDTAARRLANRLAERHAEVYHVLLPSEPDGSKNGADDLIVRHGFEAFERCRDEAIERGPHGTEALRAAWRRQRAINRELQERCAATAALIEVPTAQLDAGEKAVLFTAAAEIEKRLADKGAADFKAFNLTTMAKRAGLSDGTYGRKLDRFCKGPDRLFDKVRKPTNPDDPYDPRRSIYLRPAREGCSTFGSIVWTAIRTADVKDDVWGGKREPKPIPPCPKHGDGEVARASQNVCSEVDDDGLCLEPLGEPMQRPVPRNTQDACSRPKDDTHSLPVSVAKGVQDARSTSEERCTECSRLLYQGQFERGVCDPCARSLVPS
jgi:hypothetical protein